MSTLTSVDIFERQVGPVARHHNHCLANVHVVVEYVVHVHDLIIIVVVKEHVRNVACRWRAG